MPFERVLAYIPFVRNDLLIYEPYILTSWNQKNLHKLSAIQNIFVNLPSEVIEIIVCMLLKCSTIKLQQFSLIAKFSDSYIS